jgi:hypothetical protein
VLNGDWHLVENKVEFVTWLVLKETGKYKLHCKLNVFNGS